LALDLVGWVEPAPGFVGFRCTQANLHFAGAIDRVETQQRPIPEPRVKRNFIVLHKKKKHGYFS
jgi:hypothetical protein